MPRALMKGINIHYQRAGQGADVVLIHGLATNLAFWYLAIFPALRKDFRVTAYDLRGHGLSDMPPSGYTLADMAADLDALLEHLKVKRAHLVGHSFGAAIALQCAMLFPTRVATLTLADARLPALQPSRPMQDWSYRDAWQKKLQELGVSALEDDAEMGLPLLEQLADRRQGQRQRTDGQQAFLPFQVWNGGQQTAERWRLLLQTTTAREDIRGGAGLTLEEIRRVSHPTLAIFGERSRWLPICRILQEALPYCRAVVVPGVGHFHPLLRPLIFIRHLREFLVAV
jgi:pimeloyl-ACP methyl ester carboxylesterase